MARGDGEDGLREGLKQTGEEALFLWSVGRLESDLTGWHVFFFSFFF